ncbi:MAG: hypothetical protein AMXMBFR80_22970 [Dehalococcoidia bacterium]|jgi:hypothetical protein|nr:hypothetical protein [Tepidiformaceae bacterium]
MAALAEGVKLRAGEIGWPDDLVAEFEQSALPVDTVHSLLALKLDVESARSFLRAATENPAIAGMSFKWARPTTQLGMRARPGPNGLGMREINIGTYGTVPDHWPYENDTPLGSHPTPGAYMPGPYSIYTKSEVWAEDADLLYEQGIRERWIPAVDIDWAALETQPDEIERAICQIATSFAENGLAEQKIIAAWEERIAYGFHDVKNLLSVQNFDAGRKVEALRKRALANGGGLLQSNLGTIYRTWFGALKATEWITSVCFVYKVYEVATFEKLAEACPSAVDRKLFGLLARDSRRHLEYGVRHLAYYLQYHPNGREYLQGFLGRAEAALADELVHSPAVSEALAVLFAGGTERLAVGIERLRDLRSEQLQRYLSLLDSISMNRDAAVSPGLVAVARTGGLPVAAG